MKPSVLLPSPTRSVSEGEPLVSDETQLKAIDKLFRQTTSRDNRHCHSPSLTLRVGEHGANREIEKASVP